VSRQRRPDPALLRSAERPRGVRFHRHVENQLHSWVFGQHQVWVDYYGNEHEIESMPLGYVANVVAFCRERAEWIRAITLADEMMDGIDAALAGRFDLLHKLPPIKLTAPGAELEWLEQTPLIVALRQRLEGRERV
jgi:hypothetical protein